MLNMETSKRSGMKAGDPKRFGSFFSISGPWVRENFERHSRLMLAGIIGFAVAVLLPLIITIRTNGGAKEGADAIAGFFRGNMTGNIANNIEDYQTGDIAYHATIVFGYLFAKIFSALLYIISTVLCIAAATAVFDYLHDPAAALSTHSMPLRRGTLFRSSWLSGFIMLAIPLIIVGAVTGIILMKTGYSHTAGDLTVWIIKILICLLFIYSLSSLAAVLSGNTVTTIIAALFLNFGILAIAMIINYCMSAFLTGIDLKSDRALFLSPFFVYSNNSKLVWAVYLLISLAITALTAALCSRVKLENAGSPTMIPALSNVLTVLLSLICIAVPCLIHAAIKKDSHGSIKKFFGFQGNSGHSIEFTQLSFVVTSVIITVIAFILLNKFVFRQKLLSQRSAAAFGIFCVISAAIYGFAVYDLSEYGECNISDDDIESVEFTHRITVPKAKNGDILIGDFNIKEDAGIDDVKDLQKLLITSTKNDSSAGQEDNAVKHSIRIVYTKKHGLKKTRVYYFDSNSSDFEKNITGELKNIYRSDELKKINKLKDADPVSLLYYDVDDNGDDADNDDAYKENRIPGAKEFANERDDLTEKTKKYLKNTKFETIVSDYFLTEEADGNLKPSENALIAVGFSQKGKTGNRFNVFLTEKGGGDIKKIAGKITKKIKKEKSDRKKNNKKG